MNQPNPIRARARSAFRAAKIAFYVFGTGFVSGHLEATYLRSKDISHLLSMAERGFCGQRDVDHNFYWFSCQDAYFAAALRPEATPQGDPIGDLIRTAAKPGKKTKP